MKSKLYKRWKTKSLSRILEKQIGEMALLLPFTTPFTSSSTSAIPTARPFFRLCNKPIALPPKSYAGCRTLAPIIVLNKRGVLTVKASSDVDGAGSAAPDPPTPPTETSAESIPVENLPLESKVQALLDQRIKMKLAKKLRLRRKRLVRKRHLRKKGRWPPSKLKKNKNV